MKINVQGGELLLRNEHGDTIIVPRERRKEAMSALLKDDYRAIDSLALQLPKASRYAAGGTVLDGQDPPVEGIMGPETTITVSRPKKSIDNFFRRWGYEHSKEGSDSLLGAIGSGLGAALQLPQAAVTYMLDPKGNVKPSKALAQNGITAKIKDLADKAGPNSLGALFSLLANEHTQDIGLDPLLASGKISKVVSRGAELVNGLEKEAAIIGDKLGTKYLPNAYKLNPFAFKPNPEAYYRTLGEAGYKDAVNKQMLTASTLGDVRAPISFGDKSISMSRPSDVAYFAKGDVSPHYPGSDHIAEVTKKLYKRGDNNPVTGFPIRSAHGAYRNIDELGRTVNVPLSDATLYKKDWLKGYKEVPKPQQTFKSEINWGKWNEEISNNSELMKEYHAIEKASKADGTWMKNKTLFKNEIANAQKEYDLLAKKHKELYDASQWKSKDYYPEQLRNAEELKKLNPIIGDVEDKLNFYKHVTFTPEQFIQIQSKNFKKAFPDGFDRMYRGVQKFDADNIAKGSYREADNGNILFGTNKLSHGRAYAKNGASGRNLDHYFDAINQPEFLGPNSKIAKEAVEIPSDELLNPGVLDLVYDKNIPKQVIDAKGARWNELTGYGSTDDIAAKMKSGEIKEPIVQINNIHDGGDYFGNYKESMNTMIDPTKVRLKSLRYNNGMFDMTNPNIYKSITGIGLGTGLAASFKKAYGGEYQELELTDEEIEEYRKGGFIVEELPMAQNGLSTSVNMGIVPDFSNPNFYNPASLGRNTGEKAIIYTDSPLSVQNQAKIAAHEVGHFYRNSFKEGQEWNSFFNFEGKGLDHKTKKYFQGKGMSGNGSMMGDEIKERAAQLKDFIAHKNNIPLNKDFTVTEAHLDDAIKNYVKETGLNNNMTEMLSGLVDKKGFLKAMNNKPLAVTGTLLTTTLANKNKNKQ